MDVVMVIKRLLTAITLAFVTALPLALATATATSAQSSTCDEVSAYIEMVDALVVEEMHALVTSPGWAEDAQDAAEALNAADSDLEGTFPEMMQPLIDYLAVPGRVLDEIDDADVPESAMTLHESARDYWLVNAEMLDTLVTDGPGAIIPLLGEIETATTENVAAQDEILAQCPEIPASYAEAQERLDALFQVIDGTGDPGMLADATPEDLEGMGYFFLFFGEEDVTREPAGGSTPVVVSSPEN